MVKKRKYFNDFKYRDQNKRKFIKGKLTETGKLKKDKEDKNVKEERGKKLFQKWSKKNLISFQNEGETEDRNITFKAKNLFQNRRKRILSNDNNQEESKYNKNNNRSKFKKNFKSGMKKGKRELKTPNQILKVFYSFFH